MPFSPRQISCICEPISLYSSMRVFSSLPARPRPRGGEDVEGDHGLAVQGVHPLEGGLVGLGEVAVEILGLEHDLLVHFLMISPKLPFPMPTALPSSKSRWHSRA